jgi:hypothetical protein
MKSSSWSGSTPISTYPFASVKHRALAFQFDCYGYRQHRNAEKREGGNGNTHIRPTLRQLVESIVRSEVHGRKIA